MARGKHGTAQAVRREASTAERVAQLTAQIESERKDAAAREQALRAELQQLYGKFSRAVRETASAQVLAAHERTRAQVAEAEERSATQMREVVKYLLGHKDTLQLTAEKWTHLADLAGMTMGQFMSLDESITLNAKQRRITSRMARLNMQIKADPDAIGH